jgi:dihydroxyacetone kinase-like protein
MAALTPAAIDAAVRRIAAAAPALRDELDAADRVLGDGDTGMTVASVVAAWHEALDEPAADVGTALQRLARATRRATGSSLGSVVAIALNAAGRSAAGHVSVDRARLVALLDAATGAIAERSGASPGDKSILDALLHVRDGLAHAADEADLLAVATHAARDALEAFHGRESRLGRARIYGARSIGHDDPGMLAALKVLDAAGGR